MPTPTRLRGRPKSVIDKTEQNTVQALDRALGLLEVLAQSAGLTLSELAEQSGLPIATVFRALVTLQNHRMVEVEDPGQVWHIGPGTFRAGSAFLRRTNITERARAPMEPLRDATGETVSLAIEAGSEVLFLAQIESSADLRALFPPGSTGLMHLCAPGKALLAWYPAEKLTQILQVKGMPRATSLSLSSPESLQRDLERSRERGFAIDDQERADGMRGVAAPIFNAFAESVAAIAIAGPTFRMGLSDATRFGALVRAAADQITEATGGVCP